MALESFTVYKIKRIKITLIESIDYTFGSIEMVIKSELEEVLKLNFFENMQFWPNYLK